jgi:beta-glucosidase
MREDHPEARAMLPDMLPWYLVQGIALVQLYIEDVESSVVTALKLLKGFRRIHLKAGEAKEVTFCLDWDSFKLMNLRCRWVVEPGVFRILVGAASDDIRLEGEVTI